VKYKTIRAHDNGGGDVSAAAIVELRCGATSAAFAPQYGGALLTLSSDGFDLVRPTSTDWDGSPLLSACFPLVPFSNRIRGGRFEFGDRMVALESNWESDEHVIHGIGWRQPWEVIDRGATHCVMAQVETEWWPWRYRAVQSVALMAGRLDLSLSIENLSNSVMPVGLGFHPYLRRVADMQVQFKAEQVRDNDLARPDISKVAEAFEFSVTRALGQIPIDHCYDRWARTMTVLYPSEGRSLHIEASASARCCILFAPPGRDFFCFEPATHMTGAFEAANPQTVGLQLLSPRQSVNLEMRISARCLS
jgi:aldose 1-epimerase